MELNNNNSINLLDENKTEENLLSISELINKKKNNENNKNKDINELNELLKQLEEESLDSINSNYFTEEEKQKIDNGKQKTKYVYYTFLIFGFILMFICPHAGLFSLFFEIILNIFYPYIFIPIKLFLCRNSLNTICIPLK